MIIWIRDIPSTSTLLKRYDIIIDTTKGTVNCDCIGFKTHGRCKHIKFYKKLIKPLLHEKQGV